jgi:hypothetical protein
MMSEAYEEDLRSFTRYGKLDSYELTDEELVRMLELWRWAEWTKRSTPSGPDYDINDAVQRLQRHLAQVHNIEVEYNTALLLKQELEPLMHLRVLSNVPRALAYFLHPRRLWTLIQSLRRAYRYRRVQPAKDAYGNPRGYPAHLLERCKERVPDLLTRPYWRQLSPYNFEQRKRLDYWW